MNHPMPSKGILVSAILYFALSLVCTQIPLFNYLGYEFSLVVALCGSLVSGFLTAGTLHRSFQSRDVTTVPVAGKEFRNLLSWNLVLLLIPLLVMLANAAWVRNCSLLEGIGFYLLLPVISVGFSSSLGFFCASHYRHPKIVLTGLIVLSIGYAGFLGYFTPAIYSYNFFYGFFPGVTYDEVLEISGTLLLFRGLTIVVGYFLYHSALLLAGPVNRSTWTKGADLLRSLFGPGTRRGTTVAGLLLFVTILFRTELGFETSSSSVQKGLGSSFDTPHFTIFYSDSASRGEEILWLAAEHEFRLMQINKEFQQPFRGRIRSYIYPDAEVKRRYIGAGNTSIAKPWSGEMHLHSPEAVLKHELVHLVAAPFGAPILHASFSPGLTEGLAMAIEWDWGNRTLHEYSAGMLRSGLTPDLEGIIGSLGFAGQASSVSYVLAGSFCRYLIDRYGIGKVIGVYPSGEYEAVFGKSLHDLISEWKGMLLSIQPDEGMEEVTDVYFRAPPIFSKICARATAKKLSLARRQFAERAYADAAVSYGEAFGESGSTEALGGLLVSNLRLARTAPILAVKDSVFRIDTTSRLLPLYLPMADALWLEGRIDEARDLCVRTVKANLHRTSREGALVRLHVLHDSLALRFRSYLLSDQPDSVRVGLLDDILRQEPAHPLALYLRGKLMARLGRYAYALADLDNAGILADLRLETGRLLARGDVLFRLRRFREAKEAYEAAGLTNEAPAFAYEIAERKERCQWFEENGMPDTLLAAKEGK